MGHRGVLIILAVLLSGCAGALDDSAPLPAATVPFLSCPAPCVLPVEGVSGRPWEPHLAVDPRDPDHVVVGNAVFEAVGGVLATSWLESHVTFDGGKTWSSTRLPGGPAAGPTHPLAWANAMGDAFVTFLPDGTVLYAGLAFDHAGTGTTGLYASARTAYAFFVARSSDGGATWPDVSVVRRGTGALGLVLAPAAPGGGAAMGAAWDANDKEWLAIGPDGTILAAWARILLLHPPEEPVYRSDIVAAVSKDGGRTWSEPVLVEKGGDRLGAAPVIAPDGSMHVASLDIRTFDLRVATSRDGGATWESVAVGRAAFFPALALQARPEGDRLLLAYPEVVEDAPHAIAQDDHPQHVALRTSDDQGRTWSEPLRVDEAEAPGRTMPRLDVGPDGTAYVSFFHALPGGGAEHRVVSVKGEAGPSPSLTLDSSVAPARLLGDYVGLDATPDGAWSAWVTSRDGKTFELVAARAKT